MQSYFQMRKRFCSWQKLNETVQQPMKTNEENRPKERTQIICKLNEAIGFQIAAICYKTENFCSKTSCGQCHDLTMVFLTGYVTRIVYIV